MGEDGGWSDDCAKIYGKASRSASRRVCRCYKFGMNRLFQSAMFFSGRPSEAF